MVKTIKTATGEVLQLRFDLGTSRIYKTIAKVDPLKEEEPDFMQHAQNIFLAAYKRDFQACKQPQACLDIEAVEFFYELDLTEAIDIVKAFNEVLTVKIDSPVPAEIASEGEPEKKP